VLCNTSHSTTFYNPAVVALLQPLSFGQAAQKQLYSLTTESMWEDLCDKQRTIDKPRYVPIIPLLTSCNLEQSVMGVAPLSKWDGYEQSMSPCEYAHWHPKFLSSPLHTLLPVSIQHLHSIPLPTGFIDGKGRFSVWFLHRGGVAEV
jgi:hypothetical protein